MQNKVFVTVIVQDFVIIACTCCTDIIALKKIIVCHNYYLNGRLRVIAVIEVLQDAISLGKR